MDSKYIGFYTHYAIVDHSEKDYAEETCMVDVNGRYWWHDPTAAPRTYVYYPDRQESSRYEPRSRKHNKKVIMYNTYGAGEVVDCLRITGQTLSFAQAFDLVCRRRSRIFTIPQSSSKAILEILLDGPKIIS